MGKMEEEEEEEEEQSFSESSKEMLMLTTLQRSGMSFIKSNCWEEKGNALSDSTM